MWALVSLPAYTPWDRLHTHPRPQEPFSPGLCPLCALCPGDFLRHPWDSSNKGEATWDPQVFGGDMRAPGKQQRAMKGMGVTRPPAIRRYRAQHTLPQARPFSTLSPNVGASFPHTLEEASNCLEKGRSPGSRATSPLGPPSVFLTEVGAGLGGPFSSSARERSPPPPCHPCPKQQGAQTAPWPSSNA